MATNYTNVNSLNSSEITYYVYADNDEYGYNNTKTDQCFISIACIKAKGLPNDCYELRVLRKFRDEYVKNLFDGNEIVANYYDIASAIVNKINELPNTNEIFKDIYTNLVLTSVLLIENNKKQQAFFYFKEFIDNLKKKYLLS